MKRQQTSFPLAATALIVALGLGLAASPARAQNAVKILVNDQPITTYDIAQRTRMLQLFTHGKSGQKEATDQLIDESLMLQEAGRRHVTVTDAEVEQEVGKRATAAHLSAAQFDQALRQAGLDPTTFRQFIRANMAWAEIVRARFRATVSVTDQDVTAALTNRDTSGAQQGGEQQQAAVEYMLQQILFIVPPGAASGVEATRLKEANQYRQAFQGCDHAVEQASATPGIVVKPSIRREESTLAGDMKTELAALDVGGTTKPQRVAEGFQVIAVCAKNTIAGQTEASTAARQELTTERGQLLARRYLRDLRSDAVIVYK